MQLCAVDEAQRSRHVRAPPRRSMWRRRCARQKHARPQPARCAWHTRADCAP